jgi:hypothetical protein
MLRRIKRIRSHTGHAQFLAQCDLCADGDCLVVGFIPRQRDIESPYAYSPSWSVYRFQGKLVVVVETAHRRYDVFEVPPAMLMEYGQAEKVGAAA